LENNAADGVMGERHRGGSRRIWLAIVLALVGCGVERPVVHTTPPVADEDRITWAADEPLFIVVRTSCRTLDLYRYGERIRSFPAVFGLGGANGKLHEGDRKTPTGLYTIVDKRRHPRWQRFMLLDYPNIGDLHRYWIAMESGGIPMLGNHYAGAGGAVGIHGTDKPELNRGNVDWTWGCISLAPDDIVELADLVPVGTPVLIEE
jgi:murein L,D-transpeptidase YafK